MSSIHNKTNSDNKLNTLGAATAISLLILPILIFACRLLDRPGFGRVFGYLELLLVIPLIYLLVSAPRQDRTILYYVQISTMMLLLLVEALLDYILRLDFRGDLTLVIPYVILFFAGAGGMVGLAFYAGRTWGKVAVILFFALAALAFLQRSITGY